ncbi:hypothetical protein IQ226_23610 [Dolichospermum sp. LEGE 00240]|jgi:hypothetical protein|uniref:hypothetical protein n=1 Tax=Dolichospermum sp. LEGE 00240 TaxID=1828603 RepID=UPI0018821D9B|nr:hypothetical protein [Dolichospermum sp. LEGE 00240]MBE9252027.1 hypothetical protein [Dolichospermum sp. LEGE 00240]MDM3847869.1 hypothetical protein [Aphanizomenon gracile PMC638.10]MDM3853274.1 hypothetical protein [Aphanizomenon gracile PMC627.10]MDM3854542.1 hypothetical protein [Aphanizomenon gracile PMC649.10]
MSDKLIKFEELVNRVNGLLLLIQQNDDPKSWFLLSESGFPGLDDFQDFYLKVNQ